jgi:hypothetical protein
MNEDDMYLLIKDYNDFEEDISLISAKYLCVRLPTGKKGWRSWSKKKQDMFVLENARPRTAKELWAGMMRTYGENIHKNKLKENEDE